MDTKHINTRVSASKTMQRPPSRPRTASPGLETKGLAVQQVEVLCASALLGTEPQFLVRVLVLHSGVHDNEGRCFAKNSEGWRGIVVIQHRLHGRAHRGEALRGLGHEPQQLIHVDVCATPRQCHNKCGNSSERRAKGHTTST